MANALPVPRFVNQNGFAVMIQDEKGRTLPVQPFGLRGRPGVTDQMCIMEGEFYRRYVGPMGPLFPFPADAYPPAPVVAAPAIPVVAAAAVPQASGAAVSSSVDGPDGTAEKTEGQATPPGGGSSVNPFAKSPAPKSKISPLMFSRLRSAVEESGREDVTPQDVAAMCAFIVATQNNKGKKVAVLDEKLEQFEGDLLEIAAGRDPHRPPVLK